MPTCAPWQRCKGWPDEVVEMAKSVLVHGDPDTVGERLAEHMATGIDGLTISLAANGHIPGRVELFGEVAGKHHRLTRLGGVSRSARRRARATAPRAERARAWAAANSAPSDAISV